MIGFPGYTASAPSHLCYPGNPGSVLVPQCKSCKITVFVWGKDAILEFVGGAKWKSMKLTWPLVVVVLDAHMKFHVNLLKFTFHTTFFTRWKAQQGISATIAPFPTPHFPQNLNSNGKLIHQARRSRNAPDIETNEAFQARKTNATEFETRRLTIVLRTITANCRV